MSTAWTRSRASYYGVSSIPHVQFDGLRSVIGAGSCQSAASSYRSEINFRRNQTGGVSAAAIEGIYSYDVSNISLSATFRKDLAGTLTNLRAYLLIAENNVYSGGVTYQHITRDVYEQAITLTNVGDQVTVSHTFARNPIWNIDNIDCIAFLQNTNSKEIYQAAHLPMIADFEFAFDPALASVPEGNGVAELIGTCTNVGDEPDHVTYDLDNTFGWPAEFMVEGEAGYHTTPVTLPLGVGESRQVWVRVTTNATIRIGTGSMEITSQVSERTAAIPGRVFNGSPAILMVDDDGGRTNETLLLDALDDAHLLYDHWDVAIGHNDSDPDADEINPYDVIIWHTGYSSLEMLTTEGEDALMAFMDAGKGVILSSQDYLNTVPSGNTFTHDYLGIESYTTNVDADHATGVGGDPISDGMDFALTYQQSYWDHADDVAPAAIATVNFLSEDQDRIALRADNGTARSVFFAFCLNAMNAALPDPNNPKTLLARAVEYVKPAGSQDVAERGEFLVSSGIRAIAPNPLSSGEGAATLRLRLSQAASRSAARVDVLDLNGRLVRNLVDGSLPVGMSSVQWDGRDAVGQPVGAGVYYVRLTTLEGTDGGKVVVIQ